MGLLRFCDLVNSEQSSFWPHPSQSMWAPTATAMSLLLALRTFDSMENAMYFHLTNTQVIIVSFALVLIIIFALAAFLDKRRRTAATRRDFATDHKPDFLRQSSSRDDKDGSSDNLHALCRLKCV